VRVGPLVLVLVASLLAAPARAQQLATESFDARQGLAHNQVTHLHQDRQGYLWISTWEGVSRYDGRRFTTFGPEDGLPAGLVNGVTEAGDGTIFVATNGHGLGRLIDGPVERFVMTSLGDRRGIDFINGLAADSAGRLWCATDAGLVLGEPAASGMAWTFRVVRPLSANPVIAAPYRDPAGRLYFPMGSEVVRVDPGTDVPIVLPPVGGSSVVAVTGGESPDAIVVVTARGAYALGDGPVPTWRPLDVDPARGERFHSALRALDSLWIGGQGRVLEVRDGQVRSWSIGVGLRPPVVALFADREHNLWIGTTQGLYRAPPDRIVEYDQSQGMPASQIAGLLASPAGPVIAMTDDAGLIDLHDDGPRRLPEAHAAPLFRDHVVVSTTGEWFGATSEALYRLRIAPPGSATWRFVPEKLLDVRGTYRLAIDREHRLWLGGPEGVLQIEVHGRAGTAVERQRDPHLTQLIDVAATPQGTAWVSGMSWLRQMSPDGATQAIGLPGIADFRPRAMLVDSRGWLWIGLRYEGLAVSRNPDSATPTFEMLTEADGLSSNTVSCLAEDAAGRMYAGTGRGLDRVDLESRHVAAAGPAKVLSGAWVRHCAADARGRVWAATARGIARVEPSPAAMAEPPPSLYIVRVEMDGTPAALPGRGLAEPPRVIVPAGTRTVSVDFTAIALRPERRLRYEHRLVGLDDDWHAAPDARSVTYGRLPPGRYRFEVRAAGVAGDAAAHVSLQVLAPFWRTWWFLALAGLTVLGAALAWHRARVRALLALEGVRQQVALDLHDDVGSGLAQIAILSEVARRSADDAVRPRLDEIGTLSRALRGSMSNIVWAVDPHFDSLADLTTRVREEASRLLEAQGIAFDLDAPPPDVAGAIHLGPKQRRHVLRLVNEVVTNAARHSGATRVGARLSIERDRLAIRIEDDGRGFDAAIVRPARSGLRNLARRSEALGGSIDIQSTAAGTRVTVTVPLHERR
jgi:signal transduction histidine kinase